MHRRTARSEEGPSTSTPRRAAAAEAEEELNSPQYVRTGSGRGTGDGGAAGGAAGAAAGGGGGGSTARRRQIQTRSRWVACALCASVLLPLVAWGALLRRLLWTDGTPPTNGNLGRPLAPGTRTAGAIALGTPRLRVRGLGHDDEEGEEATDETAVADDDIHNECDRGREQQEANHAVPEDDGVTGTTDRSRRRRKVFVFPPNRTDANEHRHIFLDGIARSTRLDLSLDLCDRNADWVVDINRCTEDQLRTALTQRASAPPEGGGTSSKRRKVSAVLVDWSDGGWAESELGALLLLASDYFGRGNVHYVTRQFMDHRNMKRTINGKEFGNYGVKWSWDEEGKEFGLGGRIKAARYPVRSDLVRSISEVSGINMDGSSASTFAITQRPRSRDVASFWSPDDVIDPLQWDELTTELRASVSKLVASLGGGETRLNVTAAVVGEREDVGRSTVADAYARALLNHKIVVVAQRDTWEGHYRLMEALSGGALVMSDPMHPFPYLLQDGENIVVYSSLHDLEEKILYYIRNESERLEIAARGHRVAMNHHRSWHVMERIVLGNWTSEHF